MPRWLSRLWHHHKMEVILGLVFAVLFGVAWEVGKHTWLHAVHVEPERLSAGTVRVITAIKMENAAQRIAVENWQKDHPNVLVVKDVALLRMGSGFAVTDDGWIVTARHVVSRPLPPLLAATGAIPYFIVVYPKDEERVAAIVEADERFDTALLRTFEPPQGRYLVIGNPEHVRALDRVTVSGYPTAADYSSPFDSTVTEGEVSKVGKDSPRGTVFHITAPVGAGNSGGPLIDRHGKVIGIALGTTVEDRTIGIAGSVEPAAKMLARRHVVLPVRYERQEVARRWLLVAIAASVVSLFFAFFGVALRSFWRRRFKAESSPPMPVSGFARSRS
jgi:S1-C subfamily serine protease